MVASRSDLFNLVPLPSLQGRFGLLAICEGGGTANATIASALRVKTMQSPPKRQQTCKSLCMLRSSCCQLQSFRLVGASHLQRGGGYVSVYVEAVCSRGWYGKYESRSAPSVRTNSMQANLLSDLAE